MVQQRKHVLFTLLVYLIYYLLHGFVEYSILIVQLQHSSVFCYGYFLNSRPLL